MNSYCDRCGAMFGTETACLYHEIRCIGWLGMVKRFLICSKHPSPKESGLKDEIHRQEEEPYMKMTSTEFRSFIDTIGPVPSDPQRAAIRAGLRRIIEGVDS